MVLLSLAGPLWAQKADALPKSPPDSTRFTRYQVISLGASRPLLRDQAISPLRYSGWGGMVSVQSWWEKPKVIKQLVLKGGGALMANEANGNQLTLLHAELHYHYYRKVKSYAEDRLRLFAGGGADAWMYFKFLSLNVNNGIGYDIGGSLKASGLLQYDFTFLKKKFTLTEQLSVPFVSVVARPPFSWPDPYDAYEPGGSWTSAVRIHSFGNYLRFQNRLTLDWFPTEKRRRRARHYIASNWRLTYEWDYMQINRPNESQVGVPALLLGRVVKF